MFFFKKKLLDLGEIFEGSNWDFGTTEIGINFGESHFNIFGDPFGPLIHHFLPLVKHVFNQLFVLRACHHKPLPFHFFLMLLFLKIFFLFSLMLFFLYYKQWITLLKYVESVLVIIGDSGVRLWEWKEVFVCSFENSIRLEKSLNFECVILALSYCEIRGGRQSCGYITWFGSKPHKVFLLCFRPILFLD